LVISLHERGVNHRLNLRRVFGRGNLPREPDSEAGNRPFPPFPDVDVIVASPLARGSLGYQGIPEKDVYDVLEDVRRRLPVDEDRIYLTGVADGAGGALRLALTRPDLWAAVALVCPEVPSELEPLFGNALHVPIRIYQGALDPLVPAESSRRLRDQLAAAGALVEYTEYAAVKHNAWDYAYRGGAVFQWFRRYRREKFPERVQFATRSYERRSAYWVQIDGLTPGEPASIDARFTGPGAIEVRTAGVDGFTLQLGDCPRCAGASRLSVRLDGVALSAPLDRQVSFAKTSGAWRAGRYQIPPGAKSPGAEGPIAEAVAGRHVYVYGTADQPDDAELERRRRIAETAAHWSRPGQRLLLTLPVKADSEVTDSELQTSDLVLFGTKETNLLVARFAPHLPLELSPSAADYGLLFIAPTPAGRYVLVNSGLPWWTGADQASRPGVPPRPLPFELLPSFGDYILFKRSLREVAAEGRFDRNWKVAAGEREKLSSSGVVRIP
jgi:pimeloyl-ACP methyl ester carboxylesterase